MAFDLETFTQLRRNVINISRQVKHKKFVSRWILLKYGQIWTFQRDVAIVKDLVYNWKDNRVSVRNLKMQNFVFSWSYVRRFPSPSWEIPECQLPCCLLKWERLRKMDSDGIITNVEMK